MRFPRGDHTILTKFQKLVKTRATTQRPTNRKPVQLSKDVKSANKTAPNQGGRQYENEDSKGAITNPKFQKLAMAKLCPAQIPNPASQTSENRRKPQNRRKPWDQTKNQGGTKRKNHFARVVHAKPSQTHRIDNPAHQYANRQSHQYLNSPNLAKPW